MVGSSTPVLVEVEQQLAGLEESALLAKMQLPSTSNSLSCSDQEHHLEQCSSKEAVQLGQLWG